MDKPILIYCPSVSRDPARAAAFIPALRRRFRVLLLEHDVQSSNSILQICAEQRPRVLLFEEFPFCINEDTGYLSSLLASLRSGGTDDLVVICSVMDVLATSNRTVAARNPTVATLLNEQFDAVLAHSDPRFARLEEFFLPEIPLSTPVHHTGFLLAESTQEKPTSKKADYPQVLVFTGGGRTGARIFRAALAAHGLLWDAHGLRMTIISDFATAHASDLDGAARTHQNLTLLSAAADLPAGLQQASVAVCRCNVAVAREVVSAEIPTLFVPDAEGELERATRLTRLRMGRILAPGHVNGSSVASSIQQLMAFTPTGLRLNRDGIEVSARIIQQLASRPG